MKDYSEEIIASCSSTTLNTKILSPNQKKIIFQKLKSNNGVYWNSIEQAKFLEGLIKFGLKKYSRKKIEQHVKTRNVIQVISFSQKFFLKIRNSKAIKTLLVNNGKASSNTEILTEFSNEFVKECVSLGLDKKYLAHFKKKEKDFHDYFKKRFKNIFNKEDLESCNLYKIKNFGFYEGASGKVNSLKTNTNHISTKFQSTSNHSLINYNSVGTEALDLNKNGNQIIEDNIDFDKMSEVSENEIEIEDIDKFEVSIPLKTDFQGVPKTTRLCMHDNLADSMLEYFKRIYPNTIIKTPKTKKYNKYIQNHFKDMNLESLKFLQDKNLDIPKKNPALKSLSIENKSNFNIVKNSRNKESLESNNNIWNEYFKKIGNNKMLCLDKGDNHSDVYSLYGNEESNEANNSIFNIDFQLDMTSNFE